MEPKAGLHIQDRDFWRIDQIVKLIYVNRREAKGIHL